MKLTTNNAFILLLASMVVACGSSDSNENATNIGNYRLASYVTQISDGRSVFANALYNGNGELIEINTTDAGATASDKFKYTYNFAGQLDTHTYDEGSNGIVDRKYQYYYSNTGLLLRREQDVGNNEASDIIRFYVMDSSNQLLGYTVNQQNTDGTSTVLNKVVYSYLSGVVDTIEVDDWPLGDIDTLTKYQYNADGSRNTGMQTSQQATDSSLTIFTYESGICDQTGMVAGFSYFCVRRGL